MRSSRASRAASGTSSNVEPSSDVIELGLDRGDALELEIDQLLHVTDRHFNGRQSVRRRLVVIGVPPGFSRGPLALHVRDYRHTRCGCHEEQRPRLCNVRESGNYWPWVVGKRAFVIIAGNISKIVNASATSAPVRAQHFQTVTRFLPSLLISYQSDRICFLSERAVDAVEVSGLPKPNPPHWRPARATAGVSLPRLPDRACPRSIDPQTDRDRPCRGGDGSAEDTPRAVTTYRPTVPTCPRCRRVTGVEEDESTGSSLRWFVCRLCGHGWSVAPKAAR